MSEGGFFLNSGLFRQDAAEVQADRRNLIVKKTMDSYIQDSPDTLNDYYSRVAMEGGMQVSDLSSEDRDEAEYLFNRRNRDKQELINGFATTKIPEAELETFVRAAMEAGRVFGDGEKAINLNIVNSIMRGADSAERADLCRKLAGLWKEQLWPNVAGGQISKLRLAEDFNYLIRGISGTLTLDTSQPKAADEVPGIFDDMVKAHDCFYSSTNRDEAKHFLYWTRLLILKYSDPAITEKMIKMFEGSAGSDQRVRQRFIDALGRYADLHGLPDRAEEGFLKKMVPAMESGDPQVRAILNGGNIWSVKDGRFGMADFICHTYANEVTPLNINMLLAALRDVPTNDLAKMEQNRSDALTLMSRFGILRDCIHDQHPKIHDLLKAMVDFYDTGKSDTLASVLSEVDYFNSEARISLVYNRENYDAYYDDCGKKRGEEQVKGIDVLRRLVKNTEPIMEEPPATSDETLNGLMEIINNGKVVGNDVYLKNLGQAFAYINDELLALMEAGEVGIEPNHILVVAWLGQRGSEALHALTYEEQLVAWKQEWFRSVLKFEELTASASSFSQEAFDEFISRVDEAETDEAAYKLIAGHTRGRVMGLVDAYKYKIKDRDRGFLWSGNIDHGLLILVDAKEPVTYVGKRLLKERIKRMEDPHYHPGD